MKDNFSFNYYKKDYKTLTLKDIEYYEITRDDILNSKLPFYKINSAVFAKFKFTKEEIKQITGDELHNCLSYSITKYLLSLYTADELGKLLTDYVVIRNVLKKYKKLNLDSVTLIKNIKCRDFGEIIRIASVCKLLSKDDFCAISETFGKDILIRFFKSIVIRHLHNLEIYDCLFESTKSLTLFKHILFDKTIYEPNSKWFLDKYYKQLERSQLIMAKNGFRFSKDDFIFNDVKNYLKIMSL